MCGEEDTGRLKAERVRNTHRQRRKVTGAEDGKLIGRGRGRPSPALVRQGE